MARSIDLNIIRDRDYLALALVQLEITSVVQNDRVLMWGPDRESMGFGFGAQSACGFGFGVGRPFGDGIFGAGYLGQGAGHIDQATTGTFVAGDYALRMRGVDRYGNAGSWSTSENIAHRPVPPDPEDLAVTAGALTWTWSDP